MNQKYVGQLVALVAYFLIMFSGVLRDRAQSAGLWREPRVVLHGHARLRGTLGRGLWFKLYWAAWALLLAVAARLLWVRGRESGSERGCASRDTASIDRPSALRDGRRTHPHARRLHLLQHECLNEYITDGEMVERRAEYERQYGKYEGIPQPSHRDEPAHRDLSPRRAATMRGSYRLVNRSRSADRLHSPQWRFMWTRVSGSIAHSAAWSSRRQSRPLHLTPWRSRFSPATR